MKLTRRQLRKIINEALEQEYISTGTFSSAGSEAKHAARRREEREAMSGDIDGAVADGVLDGDELMNIARKMKQKQGGGTSDTDAELLAKQIVRDYGILPDQGDEANFIQDIASFIERNPNVPDAEVAAKYEEGGISDDDPDHWLNR